MSNFQDKNLFIFDHFKDIEKDDLEYIYRGNLTPKLVMNILDLAKINLAKAKDTAKLKSRIYYIMGEGLQNIARHQAIPEQETSENSTIVVIHKKNYKYYIATGNLIHSDNIENLKQKLDKVNSLTVDELKVFSRYTRMTTEISEKGGASLGLIEMAKRSGNKLSYDFKELDDKYSYFYLNTEIPTMHKSDDKTIKSSDYEYPLDKLKSFHEFLISDKFLLTFKGDFNQDNLLYLLNIVKGQMDETTSSIKLYSIMVELLQNIVKHADSFRKEDSWKPGIFFINDKEEEYIISSGNYIKNAKVKPLKKKLDEVNELSQKELTKQYNKILFNFEVSNAISTGLGIIDMRRRSGKKLSYEFTQVSDELTFFTIQVGIKKK